MLPVKAHFLSAAGSNSCIPLGFLGRISCGFPSPAADYHEPDLSLDDLVGISPTSSIFLFRASGDSMIDAGIHDDDILIVDKAKTAVDGDIVIACLENEFLVKRLMHDEESRPVLMPENKRYKPIIMGEGETLLVWGVCKWVLHKL